jgi:hypothetical protein
MFTIDTKVTDWRSQSSKDGLRLTFLLCNWEERGASLHRIVTGDETWVHFMNTDVKKTVQTVNEYSFFKQAQEMQSQS